MKPFSSGKWHVWEGVGGFLLSNEETKKLQHFKTIDECINWLYLSDNKPTARQLHKHAKGN